MKIKNNQSKMSVAESNEKLPGRNRISYIAFYLGTHDSFYFFLSFRKHVCSGSIEEIKFALIDFPLPYTLVMTISYSSFSTKQYLKMSIAPPMFPMELVNHREISSL